MNKGSYEERMNGGRREQCYKDDLKETKEKIGKIKFWEAK